MTDGRLQEHAAIDPHPDKIREADRDGATVGRLRPDVLGPRQHRSPLARHDRPEADHAGHQEESRVVSLQWDDTARQEEDVSIQGDHGGRIPWLG